MLTETEWHRAQRYGRVYVVSHPASFLEFRIREPRLVAGDMLAFSDEATTKAGHWFDKGDTIQLLKRTTDAPWGVECSLGNWRVRTKYDCTKDEMVWSNIDWIYADDRLQRVDVSLHPAKCPWHQDWHACNCGALERNS